MQDGRKLGKGIAACLGLLGHSAVVLASSVVDESGLSAGRPIAVDVPRSSPASPTIPLRVELSGTQDCPSSEAFIETIVERTTHARPAEGGEMAWSLEVFVEAKGRSRLAQLIMRSTEGPWVKREVLAPNCRQAMEALSLVIAIMVETAAEQAESLDDQSRRAGEAPRALAPLPEVAAGVWIPWIDDPRFFEKRGVKRVEVHGGFSGIFGIELDQTLLPNPNVEYTAGLKWSRWQPDLISPSYAAMLTMGTGDISRKGIGEARVSRALLRSFVCPADFIRSTSVDLRPCARLDGGVLWIDPAQLEGGPTVNEQSKTAFVAKVGPAIEFSVEPHPAISIWLNFGVDMMLTRKRIEIATGEGTYLLYRPTWNNGYAGLGVGVGL